LKTSSEINSKILETLDSGSLGLNELGRKLPDPISMKRLKLLLDDLGESNLISIDKPDNKKWRISKVFQAQEDLKFHVDGLLEEEEIKKIAENAKSLFKTLDEIRSGKQISDEVRDSKFKKTGGDIDRLQRNSKILNLTLSKYGKTNPYYHKLIVLQSVTQDTFEYIFKEFSSRKISLSLLIDVTSKNGKGNYFKI